MADYQELVTAVTPHRAERLVSLDEFLAMSKEPNTIILDTRADDLYAAFHVAGAEHLTFTKFTQANLERLIPDRDTRILIYCNNNFKDEPNYLASKSVVPDLSALGMSRGKEKALTLALNIPTYINLYGYGYRNVYELNDYVSVRDPRISFEGNRPHGGFSSFPQFSQRVQPLRAATGQPITD